MPREPHAPCYVLSPCASMTVMTMLRMEKLVFPWSHQGFSVSEHGGRSLKAKSEIKGPEERRFPAALVADPGALSLPHAG